MALRPFPLLVLVTTILVSACGDSEQISAKPVARPAKILTVETGIGKILRTFPGTLRATQEAELSFRVSGKLIELPAQAGMRVKNGQLLGRLDDTDFRNELADREAKFQLAKAQHQKVAKLFEKSYASQSDLDNVIANLKAASAALKLAKDNLDYTELRAPFDGLIGHVAVENHQMVMAQARVLQLQSDGRLDVVLSVPESLITSMPHIEDPSDICVQVSFNTRPEKSYRACYKEHDSLPDTLTRSYTVVFSMPAIKDFPALPGMAVSVEIDLSDVIQDSPLRTAAWVPLGAVFEDAGKRFVWRLDDEMQVQRSEVQTGIIRDDLLQVTMGLSNGDRIVTSGVNRLREGMKVRELIKERGL